MYCFAKYMLLLLLLTSVPHPFHSQRHVKLYHSQGMHGQKESYYKDPLQVSDILVQCLEVSPFLSPASIDVYVSSQPLQCPLQIY